MKFTAIASILAALVAGGTVLFLVTRDNDSTPDAFEPALLESVSEERAALLIEGWLTGEVWNDGETIDFIKWIFINRTEEAEQVLKGGRSLPGSLPELLASAGFELLQERENVGAIRLISASRIAFPNDPHVLGLTGVAAILAGRKQEALQFLNQAETWRRDIPMVDFYLGGLLIESEIAADRARGKALLDRVVQKRHTKFSELAALTLLADRRVPLQGAEYRRIFDQLKQKGALRPDNSNLNLDVLRILLNRTLAFYPAEVMLLADLMAGFPGASRADLIGLARLAQAQGELKQAEQLLERIGDPEEIPEGSAERRSLSIALATQMLVRNQPDEGVQLLATLVKEQPDDPSLAETFSSILDLELSLQTEREVLELVLQLKQVPVQTILAALSRLIEIDPIRAESRRQFAIATFLEAFPSATGAWLIQNDGAEDLATVLMAKENTSEAETSILIEALLAETRAQEALNQLELRSDSLQPVMRSYLASRSLTLLGQTEAALEKWRETHNMALSSDAFPMVKNLGMLAIQLEQPVTALQTLYSAFSAGIPFTEEQAQILLGLTLGHGSLLQSIRVAEYLENRYPTQPRHKNNLAYFKFLADEDLDQQVDIMREICDEYPEVVEYRLTLALGLLKVGRKNEAARLIQNTQINWNQADNRAQFIYAIILAANNQRVVAQGLLQNIDQEDLIPEERALLETL